MNPRGVKGKQKTDKKRKEPTHSVRSGRIKITSWHKKNNITYSISRGYITQDRSWNNPKIYLFNKDLETLRGLIDKMLELEQEDTYQKNLGESTSPIDKIRERLDEKFIDHEETAEKPILKR